MTKQQELAIEYTIKHDPIRYFIKRRHLILWSVINIDGELTDIFILKDSAKAQCDLLNSVLSLGYAIGCKSMIQTILK